MIRLACSRCLRDFHTADQWVTVCGFCRSADIRERWAERARPFGVPCHSQCQSSDGSLDVCEYEDA